MEKIPEAKGTIRFAGAEVDLKAYLQSLMDAFLKPQRYFSEIYPTYTSQQIYLAYGLALALQGTVHAIGAISLSPLFSRPIGMLVSHVVLAAIVLIFNNLFAKRATKFEDVFKWLTIVGTITALFSAAATVLSLVLPVWFVACVTFVASIYLFITGAQHALGFSKGQAWAMAAIPSSLGAITIVILISIATLSATLPVFSNLTEANVEKVLGDTKAIEELKRDPVAIKIGENYDYTFSSTKMGAAKLRVATSQSEHAPEDIKITFSIDSSEGEFEHEVFVKRGANSSGLDFAMTAAMQSGDKTPEIVTEVVTTFITANSPMLDGMAALGGLMTMFVPKSALKKEGIDAGTEEVKIAGRRGYRRTIKGGEDNASFSVAKDTSLAFPVLEFSGGDDADSTKLTLTRYRSSRNAE